jgi:hypothetical protein
MFLQAGLDRWNRFELFQQIGRLAQIEGSEMRSGNTPLLRSSIDNSRVA